MEDWRRPKRTGSPGESGDTEPGGQEGVEAIAQYGRGKYDEATGLYEFYEDIPKEVTTTFEGGPLTWGRILEKGVAIVADFRSEYGLSLASPKVRRRLTWLEFTALVQGLLMADTRLLRELKPDGGSDERGSHDGWVDQREADA